MLGGMATSKKGAQAPRTRKKAADDKAPAAKRTRRKKAEAAGPRGLPANGLLSGPVPPEAAELARAIEADGGSALATYRDPLGSHPIVLAALPIELVEPTPFQRDLSETHVKRLAGVLDKIDLFLDPIIAVRTPAGKYWTPNGNHRLNAMKQLGARALVGLVLPDERVAYQILALNTEKAHNVREKALEVIRMARSLAEAGTDRSERDMAFEFEEPSLLTLGLCYEARGRFSGGSYQGLLRATDDFLDAPLARALETRQGRAERLVELDDAVTAAAAALKARGFESPYLKPFVIARCNPLRFQRGARLGFDELMDRMIASAKKFDPGAVRPEQIARAAGPPPEEGA
jgi:ParB family chromosome partitioning protein